MTLPMDNRIMEQSARDIVYRSSLLLDEENFIGWLDECCAPDFEYQIKAYSPEIRKEMTWLKHDNEELRTLIKLLPVQNLDASPILRHVVVGLVSCNHAAASVTSSVAFFRTREEGNDPHVDTGTTYLFAAGRYHDVIEFSGGRPLLKRRSLQLQTRELGIGCHWPL